MGNRTWTSDRERQFLMEHLNQFEEASSKKNTARFFVNLYDKFFKEFPVMPDVPNVDSEVIRSLQKRVSAPPP